MGGVAFQQFFILVFVFFAIKFHRTLLQQMRQGTNGISVALPLLYAVYAVLILITVCWSILLRAGVLTSLKLRIGFRLAEYAHGFRATIPTHEAYQYGLDSVPMLLALVILNVVHPARIMPGKESDLPSRKARKTGGVHDKWDSARSTVWESTVGRNMWRQGGEVFLRESSNVYSDLRNWFP